MSRWSLDGAKVSKKRLEEELRLWLCRPSRRVEAINPKKVQEMPLINKEGTCLNRAHPAIPPFCHAAQCCHSRRFLVRCGSTLVSALGCCSGWLEAWVHLGCCCRAACSMLNVVLNERVAPIG